MTGPPRVGRHQDLHRAWTAIAARKVGLDLANFGYAGAGRGEVVSAEHIAALEAEIISVAYGATCWTRIPYSLGMVDEGFRAFLDVVRQGHATTPDRRGQSDRTAGCRERAQQAGRHHG